MFDQFVNADQVAGVKVCNNYPLLLTCNIETRENVDQIQTTASFYNKVLLVSHIKGFENVKMLINNLVFFIVDPISEIKQHSKRSEAWRSDSFYRTNRRRKNHSTE